HNSGYQVLFLHRPLEPKKAEGIILPEIETALITNSPPFQIKPGPDDKIIDMMECLDFSDRNKKESYNREISEMVDIFDGLIFQAIQHLKYAKENHDKLEEYYISCMDFKALEKMRKDFFKSIECIYPE
ncbi:MAG TPA: hypothetical protein VKY40_00550, partial [Halanaerobiales bacterium]|nr:hypothetical protein [Halanaerobiales bacterium]